MVKRVVQLWVVPVEELVAFVRTEIVVGGALRAFSFGDASILRLPLKSNCVAGAAGAERGPWSAPRSPARDVGIDQGRATKMQRVGTLV